jgi:hypothetical protein
VIPVKDAAKKLRLSEMRVRQLLQAKRIVGAQKLGRDWLLPDKIVIKPPLKVEHRRKRRK